MSSSTKPKLSNVLLDRLETRRHFFFFMSVMPKFYRGTIPRVPSDAGGVYIHYELQERHSALRPWVMRPDKRGRSDNLQWILESKPIQHTVIKEQTRRGKSLCYSQV